MAHDPSVRGRARDYYLGRRGVGWIAQRTGVSRATIQRWKREDGWDALREKYLRLEREAGDLVLSMTQAARESGDPQQAFAAMHAARMAGLTEAQPIHPAPADVAKVFIQELVADAELGPILRRRRKEIVERISAAVERLAGSF